MSALTTTTRETTTIMSNPLRTISIPCSVAQAVAGLTNLLHDRGLEIFAVIDHNARAVEAGLRLGDEVVVLFGSPKVGTILMQEDRRIGLELPLRILLWDEGGFTHATYADPHEFAEHYDLKSSEVLTGMSELLESLSMGLTQNPDLPK